MISEIEERLRSLIANYPVFESLLWFTGATACVALLVWFLLFSGYGAPPEFIYDQF